ncbi:uncharacterized protein KY384_001287 [Bacidia gigantensis]|uniref:uncharacterized protein n=1 Tax=Bacidia gigantensis TaxID=2732470 RepID=UPI001D05BCE2|nr:uncharacterized protein KY384_001287 [Bacidia gigantensis]KAG8533547.1 hypothetical protein KY384_001287 [Bacidia gigantensis]
MPSDTDKLIEIARYATQAIGAAAIGLIAINQLRKLLPSRHLWGRGYSSSPLHATHNAHLFHLQILYAITSSSIPWTGKSLGGFALLGFSLGGGIAMSFTAAFPELIDSMILLGPAGILRILPGDYLAPIFKYHAFAPAWYVRRRAGLTLGVNVNGTAQESDLKGEMGVDVPSTKEETSVGKLDFPAMAQWQFDNHHGCVHSWLDTLNNAPVMHQHAEWEKVIARLGASESGISKLLVIFGEDDQVVNRSEVGVEMAEMFTRQGKREKLDIRTVPGDHGFPVTQADAVVEHIADFWQM